MSSDPSSQMPPSNQLVNRVRDDSGMFPAVPTFICLLLKFIQFQVNNPQEILSPAILSQSGLTSADPQPTIWDPWSIIYHFETLGPIRIPSNKLSLHSSARKHTFQDIEDLADAIIDDDQRALHPVLAELTDGIVTKDQFYKFLHNIRSSTAFPSHILNSHTIVGHVIHGAKRLQAARRLLESHVYVKFVYSGSVFFTICSIFSS